MSIKLIRTDVEGETKGVWQQLRTFRNLQGLIARANNPKLIEFRKRRGQQWLDKPRDEVEADPAYKAMIVEGNATFLIHDLAPYPDPSADRIEHPYEPEKEFVYTPELATKMFLDPAYHDLYVDLVSLSILTGPYLESGGSAGNSSASSTPASEEPGAEESPAESAEPQPTGPHSDG